MSKKDNLPEVFSSIMGLSGDNILMIKDYLMHKWHPKDSSEAIKMKNIQHIFTASRSHINKACESMLDRCAYCENERVDSRSGLKVLRKNKPSKKVFNTSDEIERLEEEMSILKRRLEEARQRAGYTTQQEEGFNYTVKF